MCNTTKVRSSRLLRIAVAILLLSIAVEAPTAQEPIVISKFRGMGPEALSLPANSAVKNAASFFSFVTPSTALAGTTFNVTVTFLNPGFYGTVWFASSDPAAVLPAQSPLTNNTGTFSVTLNTAGNQTLTLNAQEDIFLFPSVTNQVLVIDSAAHIPTSERNALIAIYTQTNGGQWQNNSNWCASTCPQQGIPAFNAAGSECVWFGVVCDAAQTHVTMIALRGNNLVGYLPDLNDLTAISYLDVSQNSIPGIWPDFSGNSVLNYLDVSNSQISGPLPLPPATDAQNAGVAILCPNPMTLSPSANDSSWDWLTGKAPWWGPTDGGCDSISSGGFDVPTYAEWIKQSNAFLLTAQQFLNLQISLGSTTSIQDTISFITAHSNLTASISSDGATIVVGSQEGLYTQLIVTDGPDRPWNYSPPPGPVKSSSPSVMDSSDLTNLLAATTATEIKNNKVLLLLPQPSWASPQDLNDLIQTLQGTGHEVHLQLNPIDVNTMLSLPSYGTVLFLTHGATGSPSPGVQPMTAIDSNMPATPDNLAALANALHSDLRTSNQPLRNLYTAMRDTHVNPWPTIGYTAAFFKSLDLSGTLLLMGDCYSAKAIPSGLDLQSAVTRMIGWQNAESIRLDQEVMFDLLKCLAFGASIDACQVTVKSESRLNFIAFLNYVSNLGTSSINDLALTGDGTATVPSNVGPNGYCVNEWVWDSSIIDWDKSRFFGSTSFVSGDYCPQPPVNGCISYVSFGCGFAGNPANCSSICQ